jgi:hypothetical protein
MAPFDGCHTLPGPVYFTARRVSGGYNGGFAGRIACESITQRTAFFAFVIRSGPGAVWTK